jgi:hypothetical protein
MGNTKPHRYQIIDRQFPVRLTFRVNPDDHHQTQQWLDRHIGKKNYGTVPQTMWGEQRAFCIHFQTLHQANLFVIGNPHVQLYWEEYQGSAR